MGACCSSGDDDNRNNDKPRYDDRRDGRQSGSRTRSRSRETGGGGGGGREERRRGGSSSPGRPLEKHKYIVQWNYQAASKSELNLTKGEKLQSEMEECDAGPEWVFVSKVGKDGTGYAPRAYMAQLGSLETESWFFGEIKREAADLLLEGLIDGMFLVRSRMTRNGITYALSVAYNNLVKHYRVKSGPPGRDGGETFVIGKGVFENIPEMVRHYRSSSPDICCPLVSSPSKREPERINLPADVQKRWQEIPRGQIEIVNPKIGKGHFGVVKKGVWRPTNEIALEVAVKELKQGSTEARSEFLKEALAMKNLLHERLVKLHGVVSAEEPFWLVTEFMKDGALKTYLRNKDKEQKWLPEAKLVEIAAQVADGMRYLESRNVVHRDLAARNVLVSETQVEGSKDLNIVAKVADLGMAALVRRGRIREKQKMTLPIKWTAPEALSDLRFSSASDVWSFGILLHEIFTHGQEPYKGLLPSEVQANLARERKFGLERAEGVPEKIYALMCDCCQFQHSARMTFQDIYDVLDKVMAKGVDPYERYRR